MATATLNRYTPRGTVHHGAAAGGRDGPAYGSAARSARAEAHVGGSLPASRSTENSFDAVSVTA